MNTHTPPTDLKIDHIRRLQLLKDGFCLFPQVLSSDLKDRLKAVITRLLRARAAERKDQLTTGSMIATNADPAFAELIAYPPTLEAIKSLGYLHPTFTDGYIISKPPRGPRLFWHYDWFAWETPEAFKPEPMQLFVMYYLSDTSRQNGCLRVIPGSHYKDNPLHASIAAPHSKELTKANTTEENPAFSDRPDEIDVPVAAGDLLVGDARILHAAHSNQTDQERMLITLWYQPDFSSLPEGIRAQMVAKAQPIPATWPTEARQMVEPLAPHYHGTAAPAARSYRPATR